MSRDKNLGITSAVFESPCKCTSTPLILLLGWPFLYFVISDLTVYIFKMLCDFFGGWGRGELVKNIGSVLPGCDPCVLLLFVSGVSKNRDFSMFKI